MLKVALVAFALLAAASTTQYRPPSDFKGIPQTFRQALEREGCKILQAFAEAVPHNVIAGRFARSGQRDWAALCSRDGKTRILIHWGGPTRCKYDFPAVADSAYEQSNGERIVFSRRLRLFTKAALIGRYQQGPDRVIRFNHDAIEDTYLEKGSTVLYCHDGEWQIVPGQD